MPMGGQSSERKEASWPAAMAAPGVWGLCCPYWGVGEYRGLIRLELVAVVAEPLWPGVIVYVIKTSSASTKTSLRKISC